MPYSRGTDNDAGARRIIYQDGKPLVHAYYDTTAAADLDELVRRANAFDQLTKEIALLRAVIKEAARVRRLAQDDGEPNF